MSKPTLWQALLGKPSQSYTFPSDKHYFSTKHDLLRIATQSPPGNPSSPAMIPDTDSNDDEFSTAAGSVPRDSGLYEEEDDGNMSDSEDGTFYTPNTSPRLSMVSRSSGGSAAFVGRRSPGTFHLPSQRSSKAAMNKAYVNSNAGLSTIPDAPTVVVTKNPRRTGAPAIKEVAPIAGKSRVQDKFSPAPSASTSSREYTIRTQDPTPSSSRGHTSTSSLSSTSLDGQSLFSSTMTNSTRTSLPFQSENDVRSARLPKQELTTNPDEDRASDSKTSTSKSTKRKSLPTPSGMTHIPSNGGTSHTPQRKQGGVLKNMSKTNASIMMNMTALLEEDEDVSAGGGLNFRTYSKEPHPQSNVVLVQPAESRASSKLTPPLDDTTRSSRIPSISSTLRSTSNSISSGARDIMTNGSDNNGKSRRPDLRHRRSRSHEDLRSNSRSEGRSRAARTSISALAPLPMPTGDLPSHGTPGYSSLVLPRAPPPVSLNPRAQAPKMEPSADGKIDLTRSGIAQTTMATVEVIHGLGANAKTGNGFLGALGRTITFGRRKTVSGRAGPEAARARRSMDNAPAPGGFLGSHQPLGFTSYRKPPDYVSSSGVLVQVWAVGVDYVDARLVGLRLGSCQNTDQSFSSHKANTSSTHSRNGSLRWKLIGSADQNQHQPQVSYIPGRSFVGRVLEKGWEVGDEVARKGDWVVGLLEIRKAGALSEFIVADKWRIHRVPQPKMNNMSLKALGKQPERSSSAARMPVWGLTLEELALLPLCGVPAYRAVRTFMYAFSSSSMKEADDMTTGSARVMSNPRSPQLYGETGRRPRALVLRGHDGVGGIAARMLIARDWDVSIHVPCPFPTQSDEAEIYMSAIEDRARAWGCDEVIFDDGLEEKGDEGRGAVVRILDRLWSEGDVVDAVLDTVGGKDVWEAAERLLKSSGSSSSMTNSPSRSPGKKHSKTVAQFTTLVGDSPNRVVPSAGDLFKAGVRSLRMGGKPSAAGAAKREDGPNTPSRSGRGTGGRKVSYAWINAAQDVDWEGQDISETIEAALRLALEGIAKPWVGAEGQDLRVITFERAPEVFVDNGPLSHGSTAVVKIVE